ncbi:MAG: exodeoxyribonuclease VII small subunit [Burkholderiaceae bacterium]|nr:Exodeoxyribonuclease 7 small subunit [Betaproteobacteria bacterium MOLA814]
MTKASPPKAIDTQESDQTTLLGQPTNYETALNELETLVQLLEAGQLPLDQLLGQYKRGAELLHYCRAQLDAVEAQVRVVEGDQAKAWERDA